MSALDDDLLFLEVSLNRCTRILVLDEESSLRSFPWSEGTPELTNLLKGIGSTRG